jgi:hypothetical protein
MAALLCLVGILLCACLYVLVLILTMFWNLDKRVRELEYDKAYEEEWTPDE